MPLAKTDTHNEIRGRIVPNREQRLHCQAVINQVSFHDLGRGAGKKLHKDLVARLDMQGRTATHEFNLQIQIGNHTAATALVADSVLTTKDHTNQSGVSNALISVLQQSLDSGTVWRLSGSLP